MTPPFSTGVKRQASKPVTAFVWSTGNLLNRGAAEAAYLMQVIEQVLTDKLTQDPTRRLHIAGILDVLPDTTARALGKAAEAGRSRSAGAHVTLAVGYGGRQEVIDALGAQPRGYAAAGTTLATLA